MENTFERLLALVEKFCGGSQTAFAKSIGVKQSTFYGYLNCDGQSKIRLDMLINILKTYPTISHDWLFFGKGAMLSNIAEPLPENTSPLKSFGITPAVPVVGLAACGVEGLEQIMPYHMTASPIALSPRAFAVLASGESMVPAGIASGHMCFCDPDQQALPGEAVFLRQKDNLGALKLFLGKGEAVGFTSFRGWLSARDEHNHQKLFQLDVRDEQIDCIAPVVCIRRRG